MLYLGTSRLVAAIYPAATQPTTNQIELPRVAALHLSSLELKCITFISLDPKGTTTESEGSPCRDGTDIPIVRVHQTRNVLHLF